MRLKPDYAEARAGLGNALFQMGQVTAAIGQYEQALQLKPKDANVHYHLGLALEKLGKTTEAMGQYEQALQIAPDRPEVQNNLAWLLATRVPAEGGDPVRAVTLAEGACSRTANSAFAYLDTLAAAYASAGPFTDAVAAAQRAVEQARAGGESLAANEIGTRLGLYREDRAYRETKSSLAPP